MVKLSEIAEILDSSIVSGKEFGSKEFLYCRGSDLMSDVLAEFAEGSVFLTGLITVQSIRTASVSGAGAIIFVRGKQPSEQVLELAVEENIPVIVSPHSMFVSCGRLYNKGLTGVDGSR